MPRMESRLQEFGCRYSEIERRWGLAYQEEQQRKVRESWPFRSAYQRDVARAKRDHYDAILSLQPDVPYLRMGEKERQAYSSSLRILQRKLRQQLATLKSEKDAALDAIEKDFIERMEPHFLEYSNDIQSLLAEYQEAIPDIKTTPYVLYERGYVSRYRYERAWALRKRDIEHALSGDTPGDKETVSP